MRTQIAITELPDWAEGLSPEVIQTVRQEAMKAGVRPVDLVKEWTVKAARSLTTAPTLPTPPADPALNASPADTATPPTGNAE